MTPDERFATSLSAWLIEDAEHRVPGHLAEVLVRTAATRQRPWWSSPRRFLPMTTTLTGRVATRPVPLRLVLLAALALLLAALAGLAVVGSSPKPLPRPFALAANGRILATDGSSLVSIAADGSERRTLASLSGGADSLSLSPDGTRAAYQTHDGNLGVVHILPVAGGPEVTVKLAGDIASDPIGWSPDGQSMVFAGQNGAADAVFILGADGHGLRAVDTGAIGTGMSLWQPQFSPDGTWIAVTAQSPAGDARLYLLHPDGTRTHALPPSVVVGNGGLPPAWQPDPTAERIAFQDAAGVSIYDVGADRVSAVGPGFWPVWSPDGRRLAYWNGGTNVVSTADVLAGHPQPVPVFARVPADCPGSAALTGTAVCSPVSWSADGASLIAGDIAAPGLLVARADGSGTPTRIALDVAFRDAPHVVWQPVAP